jgi:hypothetical protein
MGWINDMDDETVDRLFDARTLSDDAAVVGDVSTFLREVEHLYPVESTDRLESAHIAPWSPLQRLRTTCRPRSRPQSRL